MSAINLNVDVETGELIPLSVMVPADRAPAILIDISDVQKYHTEPEKILEKIRIQAGYPVFDISKKAGRDACRTHAANIVKTISPAVNASKALAAEAKKVINQDLSFRRDFENGVREIAAFHRAPLTEYEEEQARIEEEKRLAALKIEEERLYLLDWDDALALNELYNLRKEKEAEEARIAFEKAVKQGVEQEQKRLAELQEKENRVFKDKDSLIKNQALDALDFYEPITESVPEQGIVLTRTVLIDAVAAYLGITMREAEKALYETFLI